MTPSQFFKQTLFFKQPSVADEYYKREVGLVFEKEDEKARIEARCWSALDLEVYQKRYPPLGQLTTIPSTKAEPSLGCIEPNNGCVPRNTSGIDVDTNTTSSTAALNPTGPSQVSRCGRLAVIDLDLGQLERFIQHTNRSLRIFYVRQRNSFSRLQITKEKFNLLLHECRVFPQFSEFILDFRWKVKETEIGPPRIKFRPLFLLGNESNVRHGYETAYVVRYMEFTNRSKRWPWSLRQFAVYHKSVPSPSAFCSTWILVGASQRTERSFDEYAESVQDFHRASPFELHILFLDVAIASWRPYISYLLDQLAELSDKSVLTMIGREDTLRSFYTVEVKDSQRLKEIEDRASDVLLCLDSTLDTVVTLADMYHLYFCMPKNPDEADEPFSEGAQQGDAILFALKEKQGEVSYARQKVEALLAKSRNTRALISSLLERLNGHNIDQQICALQSLERQGQEENAIMRQLAEKGSRDSASVRILTIITLIYLPCTVVSSFYSTQFVKQTETASGESSMEYAQNAWLFFAVSLPLTLFTIAVWYAWANYRACYQAMMSKQSDRKGKIQALVNSLGFGKEKPQLPC